MNVEVYTEKAKPLFSYYIPYTQRTTIKRFLQYLFDRRDGKPKKHYLYFAGGEWEVSDRNVGEMYKQIVRIFTDLEKVKS